MTYYKFPGLKCIISSPQFFIDSPWQIRFDKDQEKGCSKLFNK